MGNFFTNRIKTIKNVGLGNALTARFRRPSKSALRVDSNIYNPQNDAAVGNTIGNYFAGVQSPPFYTSPANNKNYTVFGSSNMQQGPGINEGNQVQDPGISDGSGAGVGEAPAYEPNLVEYPPGSGFYYDLNNDIERQSFYDRRLLDLQGSRDEQIAQIDQQIADLTGSSQDYVKNYFKQLEDFGAVKGQGDVSRIDAYTQASPNAFQSSEGVSYDLANKNYLKGIGEAADQANQDVGGEFLANPNDVNLLAEDTNYGRQLQNYYKGRNEVGDEYNDYLAGIQQQNNPATNPFRFSYQAAGLNAPKAVNISGYNPFVDFKRTSGAATPGPGFRPAGGRNFNEGTAIDSFLGRTKLNPDDTNYLRRFLLGQS